MKTNLIKSTLLATSLILALTACTSQESASEKNKRIQANSAMEANELVDAGEQLVGPYTFMAADKIFDMALQKDPENRKAQFYKNFLKRPMVLKGIAKRIRPLIYKGTPEQIENYEKQVRTFPESPMKKFLLDGTENIHSNSQVVDVIAEYVQALNEFRKFAKLNPDLELTLSMNPHVFSKEIDENMANSCVWNDQVTDTYRSITVDCDYSEVTLKKLNSADLVALGQEAAGEMLYLSLLTAYDMSVFEQASADPELLKLSVQERINYAHSLPSVAKLRSNHTLNLIPELGSDFSAAAKWAIKYQDRLCPKGNNAINQRKGFLVKDGICVENASSARKSLAMLDQILAGNNMQPIQNDRGETVGHIRMNLPAFVTNPPADLKNILPLQVDENEEVTQWKDKTFGGLFPDGDIEKLKQNRN